MSPIDFDALQETDKIQAADKIREILDSIPRIPLGIYPTPLHKLPNVSRELGVNVWVKRDDLCGVGLGGNKVRKLQYLLAEAKAEGCDTVMTTGGAQSNHAMLTAACARKLGMNPILVLKERGVCTRRGNQVLNYLMGAEVIFVDTDDFTDTYEMMDDIEAKRGLNAYKVPYGGSNGLGAMGYVDCMREVASQTAGQLAASGGDPGESVPGFDWIFHACGSGGTAAGSILGGRLFMPGAHVVTVAVDTDPFSEIVSKLVEEEEELLGIRVSVPEPDILEMVGEGYAIPSPEGNEAIAFMIRNEGIVLDTCYSGKAFAGLLKYAREGRFGKDDNVLFIHTGGAGGLFAQDWEHLSL